MARETSMSLAVSSRHPTFPRMLIFLHFLNPPIRVGLHNIESTERSRRKQQALFEIITDSSAITAIGLLASKC